MKTNEGKMRELPRKSRRETLLLIALFCLTAALTVLLLLFLDGRKDLPEEAEPTSETLAAEATDRGQASSPEGSVPYQVLPDVEAMDISQMSPEELPAENSAADALEVEIIQETEGESKPYQTGWMTMNGNEYFVHEDGSYAFGLKQIGGKLYYFNQYAVKAKSLGVDVSYYNSDIDWDVVKAQGIDFVIIRIGGRGWTSGLLYDDCRMREYLRSARKAGLQLGAYFYSTATTPYEAVEEASVAVRTLDGIPLDLPLYIDMEFSGEYPKGRADRLTPSERAGIATAFCETVRSSGYQPGVYAGQNFFKAYLDYNAVSRYSIWLASYTTNNELPLFDKRYDLWQFTERGRVDGIRGIVDLNVIY